MRFKAVSSRGPMKSVLMICLGCALAAATQPASAQTSPTPRPELALEAEGRVTAAPDQATLDLGVDVTEDSAKASVDTLGQNLDAVLAALAAAGVAEGDVDTSRLALSPVWSDAYGSRREREVAGYRAQSSITVRVREIDDTGAVLDAAVRAGVNQISSVRFDVADPGPLRDRARREAVAEGRRLAALYAEAAGVTLGPLLRLTPIEEGRPAPFRAEMAATAASASVPVVPGDVVYTARVSLVYGLGAP